MIGKCRGEASYLRADNEGDLRWAWLGERGKRCASAVALGESELEEEWSVSWCTEDLEECRDDRMSG